MQTDATLLANNSQHCWMLHVAPVCTPCFMFLRVLWTVEERLKLVKLLAPCKRANNVGSCGVRLHIAKRLTCFKLCTTTPKQHTTTCNRVGKWTKHVTSKNFGVNGHQCCVRLHIAYNQKPQFVTVICYMKVTKAEWCIFGQHMWTSHAQGLFWLRFKLLFSISWSEAEDLQTISLLYRQYGIFEQSIAGHCFR